MATDFSKPVVTDAYATLLPGVVTALQDIARGLDPALTGTSTNIPTGTKRFNESTGWWERYNGTSWVLMSMTGNFGTLAATGNIAGRTSNGYAFSCGNGIDTDLGLVIATNDAQIVNTGASSKISHIIGGITRTQTSATGLAVTGALSATGEISSPASIRATTGGYVYFNNAANTASANLQCFGSSLVAGTNTAPNLLTLSSTGLAVTGALSATGVLTTAGLKEDASGNLGLGVTPSAWYTALNTKVVQFGTSGALFGISKDVVLANNEYAAASGSDTYLTTGGAALQYRQTTGGQHQWLTALSGTAGNAITFTTAMTLDTSSNLAVTGTVTGTNLFGQGQTMTDVTASRAMGSSYTNSTNRTIFVNIRCSNGANPVFSVDGVPVGMATAATSLIAFPVPPGKVYTSSASGGTLNSWTEYR